MPAIALVDHLMDSCAGAITAPSMERAIGWANYLEKHANRVYAGVLQPELYAARIIRDRLMKGELPSPFKVRQVYRRGWSGLSDKDIATEAVGILEDHGETARVHMDLV